MEKTKNICSSLLLLLACLLWLPCACALDNTSLNGGNPSLARLSHQDREPRLGDLPAKVEKKISQHLHEAEYEVSPCERPLPSSKPSTYQALNCNQNMSIYFTDHGITLLPHGNQKGRWHLEMTLCGYGYVGSTELVQPVQPDEMEVLHNRIAFRRGALTEWYVNDERGFEQGVTLAEPPAGKKDSPLVVEWAVSGSLTPRLEHKGTAIVFCNAAAESVLRYSGLKAWDTAGRPLRAKLTVRSADTKHQLHRIAYVIETAGALYPVTIDPLFTQEKKITASDGTPEDEFGHSVSISGNTVVVGAPQENDIADPGVAYIFERDQDGANNWGQVKKITASDGERYDQFGYSVSISGDTLVVGAYGDDDLAEGSGAAYIFERDHDGAGNWGQVKKITASDGEALEGFGFSVSISGDTVVVGAPYDNDYTHWSGAAYIFKRDQGGTGNWGQVKKITASDVAPEDWFGYSVSISGDTLVVGVPWDDDGGSYSGSASLFERNQGGDNNWGQVIKIIAFDDTANDEFGIAVAISGDTVIVGAFADDDQGNASGSAYIYGRDQNGPGSWGLAKKITPSEGQEEDSFGLPVAISGDTIIVGASGDDDHGSCSGAAYLFGRNQGGADNWGELAKITASDGAEEDYFGKSVAISGETVVVGAYRADIAGNNSGAAYLFHKTASPVPPICPGILQLLLLAD